MNSITRANGKRTEYRTYNAFMAAKKELRECGIMRHWVSYYDKKGDTHICLYIATGNTVECCGLRIEVPNDLPELGDFEAGHQACRIAREENFGEFRGWTI